MEISNSCGNIAAFRLPGRRSQKSLQLFLIKARMMTEWGMLKHFICCSTDGKHEGSVPRQDVIRLPKKQNQICWYDFDILLESRDFAAVQGRERHTRLPMSLKCAATQTTFSGKKRENGLRSARRGKDNYLKLDLARTLITREVATSWRDSQESSATCAVRPHSGETQLKTLHSMDNCIYRSIEVNNGVKIKEPDTSLCSGTSKRVKMWAQSSETKLIVPVCLCTRQKWLTSGPLTLTQGVLVDI